MKSALKPPLEFISRAATGLTRTFPPLLFIHGGWHGAWCWEENFLPYFSQLGFHCHALSFRGHSVKEQGLRQRWHSIADYCADLDWAVRQCAEPPVLVAHSMGGLIATRYLSDHSLPAAVLLAPIPLSGFWRLALRMIKGNPGGALRAVAGLNCQAVLNTPGNVAKFMFSPSLKDELVRRYFSRIGDESYRVFIECLVLGAQKKAKDTPIHLFHAEDDRLVSRQDSERNARFLSAKLYEIEGVAHDMMLDTHWQQVAERLVDLFDSLSLKLKS